MDVLVLLLSALCVVCILAKNLIDIPNLGKLKCTYGQSFFSHRIIYEFRGVPYAEPPVEDRRFAPPKKKAAWSDERDATMYGRVCPQISKHDSKPEKAERDDGDPEDCLFLDVYTPQLDKDRKLAVLFYIHGGSFVEGTSQDIRPDFLLEHDIVLVAPQYRLGPLGFLSLKTEGATGNAGLFDQLMALQWVRDHIEQFGGDPGSITVSGWSAGAASAALLYVSPQSQGLIQSVMLFSGSALAVWALDTDPLQHSYAISAHAGCQGSTDDELLSCLRGVKLYDLLKASVEYSDEEEEQRRPGRRGSLPVIDNRLLHEMPKATLRNPSFPGRPMLMSVTKHEGIFLAKFLDSNLVNIDSRILKHDIGDILLRFSGVDDNTQILSTAIKDLYFRPEALGNEAAMLPGIIDFLGSAHFKGPAFKMAELNSLRAGQTFLVTFNYYSQGSHTIEGVHHGADQKFIFPQEGYNYIEEETVMVRKLTQLYSNFVIYGTPTVNTNRIDGLSTWDPFSQNNNVYLSIDGINSLYIQYGFEQEFTATEEEGLWIFKNYAIIQSAYHHLVVLLFFMCTTYESLLIDQLTSKTM